MKMKANGVMRSLPDTAGAMGQAMMLTIFLIIQMATP
jgi:hypothetical protein